MRSGTEQPWYATLPGSGPVEWDAASRRRTLWALSIMGDERCDNGEGQRQCACGE